MISGSDEVDKAKDTIKYALPVCRCVHSSELNLFIKKRSRVRQSQLDYLTKHARVLYTTSLLKRDTRRPQIMYVHSKLNQDLILSWHFDNIIEDTSRHVK